jgi:glucosamine 6-phosphate synthetase-like amidotransferase/phosphosugar isomerase protein
LIDGLNRLEYRGYDSCGVELGNPKILSEAPRLTILAMGTSLHAAHVGNI